MSILHEPRMRRFLIEHKRTGKIHAGHAVKLDRPPCRHEERWQPVVYWLECGGSRDRDEIRFGDELRDGVVVTCLNCRRALHEHIAEAAGVADKWAALAREFENMLGAESISVGVAE